MVNGQLEQALQENLHQQAREEHEDTTGLLRDLRVLRGGIVRGGLRRWKEPLRQAVKAIGEMLYGATLYDMVRGLRKERAQREYLFILAVFGDLLGVPILPPYYTLRLLPYVMPHIQGWRMSMLRERDLSDLCDQEIT